MSIKEGSKLLVRQISAIVITTILIWIFARIYKIEYPLITSLEDVWISDVIVVLLALIMAVLIKGLSKPMSMIYEESLPGKVEVVSEVTGHVLDLVNLAVLYIFLRKIVESVLDLYIRKIVPELGQLPGIIYDVAFIIAGLLIVYSIIKILTR